MPKHLVFFYGTLKKGQPNNYVLHVKENGQIDFISRGFTKEQFPLVVATSCNLPFLLWSSGHGKHIVGEIYCVDDTMLSFLDEFEDHPKSYQREEILIELDSTSSNDIIDMNGFEDRNKIAKSIKCWCYFLKTFPRELLYRKQFIEDYDADKHGPYDPKADIIFQQQDSICDVLQKDLAQDVMQSMKRDVGLFNNATR